MKSKRSNLKCVQCEKKIDDEQEKNYVNKYQNHQIRNIILIPDLWGIIDDYYYASYLCQQCLLIDLIKQCSKNKLNPLFINNQSGEKIKILHDFYSENSNNHLISQIKKSHLTKETIYDLFFDLQLIQERDLRGKSLLDLVTYSKNDMDFIKSEQFIDYDKYGGDLSKKEYNRKKKKYFESLGQ